MNIYIAAMKANHWMRQKKGRFLALFLVAALSCFSQQPDTLIRKLDSLQQQDSPKGEENNIDPAAYQATTKINVPTFFVLLWSNAKQQVTAPFHAKKKDWLHVGKFALLTGAVAFADKPVQKWALRVRNSSAPFRKVSKFVTDFGGPYETFTLVGLAAYGFVFKKQKVKTTTILATQAYFTAGAIESILKFLTGRQRPNYYGTDSIEARPLFHGPFARSGREYKGRTISSAFPSGHTTVAFAAATVFAMEYRNKPFIPILAYTSATLVGLSRITENKHWATDVLVGAALGYMCGRQVVNNYHRYARLKRGEGQPGRLSFHLNYLYGQLLPGFVYRL